MPFAKERLMRTIYIYAGWTIAIIAVLCIACLLICNHIVVKNAKGKVFSETDSITPTKWGLLLGTTPQARLTKVTNYFFIYRIDAAEQLGESLGISQVLGMAEIGHFLHIGQVSTSTERFPVAFQDDDTDVVAAIQPINGFGELADHLGIQRIAHLGAVKIDPSHAFP